VLVALSTVGCVASRSAAPAVLWLGGDVHLGAGDGRALAPVRAVTGGEPLVVNLEGPVGEGSEASSAERLVNGPAAVRALAEAGVVAVGVANNHAADLGRAGQDATVAALVREGLAPLGVADLRLQGVDFVLVSVDLSTETEPASLEARLRAHRAESPRGAAAVLVVTFHVTGPPSYLPTSALEAAVAAALSAGASVVVAHGTHALARVERRGRAVIAWGLGNLVFDCRCTAESDGLLVRVEVDGAGAVTRATVVPVDAGLHGAPLQPAADAPLTLQLLESLGSSPLRRAGPRADF
jgi:poly-gamma-glutamate synthesis protein (capsule biosynthesis protein)